MPDEYELFLRQNALRKNSNKNLWVLCYSDDNTEYYFNGATREISWEKPSNYVEPTETDAIEPKVNSSVNNRNLNKHKAEYDAQASASSFV